MTNQNAVSGSAAGTESVTQLPLTTADIKGMALNSTGALVITRADGGTLVIENFKTMASEGALLTLANGEQIDTAKLYETLSASASFATPDTVANPAIVITGPQPATALQFTLQQGAEYVFDFDPSAQQDVRVENGALIITFSNGGTVVLNNYESALASGNPPLLKLSAGKVVDGLALLDLARANVEQAEGEDRQANVRRGESEENLAALAQELAEIEPAAGDAGGGAGGRGGFGFQSAPDAAPLGSPPPVGPLGPTALQFGLPQFDGRVYAQNQDDPAPQPPGTPGIEADDVYVYEDGTVQLLLSGSSNGFSNVDTVITLTGIPAGWTVDPNGGTYDAGTGTWTYTMPGGGTFNGGPLLSPPADSDIDLPNLQLTITNTSTVTGLTSTQTASVNVYVDAVADVPNLTTQDASGLEDVALPVNITTSVTDTDGSESITRVVISNVPTGFTLSAGTDLGGGAWQFTPAQLAGLTISAPAHYSGSITLQVTTYNAESSTSGSEFDLTNNTNSNTAPLNVTWTPVADVPDLQVQDVQVKEDNSVFLPVTATLVDNDGSEYLVITITGIPSGWGVDPNGGTYNAGTGTWTFTGAPGANFTGGPVLSPPADSDVDSPALTVTATAIEVGNGDAASNNGTAFVIVDAVADAPTIDALDDSGVKNTALDVDITAALSDVDGSETITHYQISGVPTGFGFSAGTDLGGGVWQFTPAQIVGLQATAPVDFVGSINLVATVFNAETNLGGNEYDTADNTSSASDPLTLTWEPVAVPPTISVNNGVDDAIVKEDGTVDVPIVAALGVGGSGNEILIVTVTGISASWGFSAPVGTYNAAAGTWTITLPPGQNFASVMTFTPPANSDIDLNGLMATATAYEPATDTSANANDAFRVVVDAVADDPTIDALNGVANRGDPIAVTLNAALTDLDGSEIITGYQISGVPSGFSFNQGTNAGGGIWTFTPAQIAGLQLTPPAFYHGTVDLVATVLNTENPVSDSEVDFTDNDNSASDAFRLEWKPVIKPPTITVNNGVDDAIVKEDGTVDVPIVANLSAFAAPTEYLTVTVTGISASWGFSAPVGTYNPATGTWTVTLAPGQNLSSAMTFTPPGDTDIDLSGLNAQVVATDPASGLSASANDAFRVVVDAVADAPTLSASSNVVEQGNPVTLNIAGAVTDLDGSETITGYQISGVPSGFSFNQGTNAGGGIWTFTPAQIAGLQLSGPAAYHGTFSLTVRVNNAETNLGGVEVDFTDNTNFATQTLQIRILKDDVPTVQNITKTVDETDLSGGTVIVSHFLTADFGSDAPGTFGATGVSSFAYSGSVKNGVLTSNGVPVTVTMDGTNTYVGRAGTETVFTLTILENGQFGFNLVGTLDHADTANHNDAMALRFGFTATDSDGDGTNGFITVNVLDDGVTAVIDHAGVDSVGGVVTGNVLTNDLLSQDTPNTVSKIQVYEGTWVDVPASGSTTINGSWGSLTIHANGDYTYASNGPVPHNKTDYFRYELRDADGDTSVAKLVVDLYAPKLIVGKNIDDVPGSTTPYQVGTGTGTIAGGQSSDILVGDVGGAKLIDQTKDYNVVMMLDVSGSMGSKTDPNSRISQLVKAVKNLIADFNTYDSGVIKVQFVTYSTGVVQQAEFVVTDDASYANAVSFLNALTGNGFTNYEAPMQAAINWLQGGSPIAGAETIAYFISDGEPNRYNNNSGTATSGTLNEVMAQLNGTADGTNEIATLKSLTDNVIGVGINIGSSTLANISQISDNPAINVTDPAQLTAVLAATNPLNNPVAVGDDVLVGGTGNDLIFGDALNTDAVATAFGLTATPGSGWEVFARLEAGESAVVPGWNRADTIAYIRANAASLSEESLGSGNVGRAGGNDRLEGGAGNDLIFGQEGDDLIIGGAGDDVLYGGSGADTFQHNALGDGTDTIMDFDVTEGDVLDLSALLSDVGFDAVNDAINNFVFATDTAQGTVIMVDATGSGNAAAAQAVAVLDGVHGVTLNDLLNTGSVTTV